LTCAAAAAAETECEPPVQRTHRPSHYIHRPFDHSRLPSVTVLRFTTARSAIKPRSTQMTINEIAVSTVIALNYNVRLIYHRVPKMSCDQLSFPDQNTLWFKNVV